MAACSLDQHDTRADGQGQVSLHSADINRPTLFSQKCTQLGIEPRSLPGELRDNEFIHVLIVNKET